ncbi:MAG: hypothetical protein US78_C0016G0012, partial [Parcubacteria group bacterium GW2011_GWD1_38_16]
QNKKMENGKYLCPPRGKGIDLTLFIDKRFADLTGLVEKIRI